MLNNKGRLATASLPKKLNLSSQDMETGNENRLLEVGGFVPPIPAVELPLTLYLIRPEEVEGPAGARFVRNPFPVVERESVRIGGVGDIFRIEIEDIPLFFGVDERGIVPIR